MENKEYAIAYKEVLEILKYIPREDFEKIPNYKIELYKIYCDKNYIFFYDPSKTLEEQNVSRRARAIIGLLFRDYWATPIQREKIIAKQQYERNRLEKEKKLKYNYDVMYKNKLTKIIENKSEEEKNKFNILPVEKKKTFLGRLVNYIKCIFLG